MLESELERIRDFCGKLRPGLITERTGIRPRRLHSIMRLGSDPKLTEAAALLDLCNEIVGEFTETRSESESAGEAGTQG